MKYQEQKFDAMDKDKNKALSQQEGLRHPLEGERRRLLSGRRSLFRLLEGNNASKAAA
jgi:hypothetical protein